MTMEYTINTPWFIHPGLTLYAMFMGKIMDVPVRGQLTQQLEFLQLWPWLLVIIGYKCDYTFYKWGHLLVLITGIARAITVVNKHNGSVTLFH